MVHALTREGIAVDWTRVESEEDYVARLRPDLDLILADYTLPRFDATRALLLLGATGYDIPFLVVSGSIGEERAAAAIREGAYEYVRKDRLERLPQAASAALEQRRLRAENRVAELALRSSQERFHNAFAHAATGMVMVSPAGRFVEANEAFCGITRYSPQELLETDFVQITHPDDREVTIASFQRLLAGEVPHYRLEKRYLRRDGGIVWVRNSVAPLRDAEGRLIQVLAIVEDITERKNAETALRRSEERFRVAAENASDMIYEWDIPTGGLEFFGRNRIGRQRSTVAEWEQAVHPGDRERVEEAVRQHLETGAPFFQEYRIADGGIWRYVEDRGSALRDESGRPYKWVGVSTDISERKRTEEARSWLAAIVQSSEDAIIGMTLEGAIANWNSGAEQMCGYRAEEVLGRPFSVLLTPACLKSLERRFGGVPTAEPTKLDDAVLLKRDGSRIPVSLSLSPVRDAQGRRIGASAIARDVSELQRMNQSLQHLSGELLRSQDEERRRIARELHDSTAQSLAGVAMNLSLLERSQVVAAAPRESRLVADAAALARQCAKEVRALSYLLHPPLLDELGLASALRSYTAGFTERTGIRVHLHLPEDFGRLPAVLETTLFRMVQECLANVHRHSGSPSAAIHIRRRDSEVTLEVEDEGHGLLQGVLASGSPGSAFRLGVGITGMRERARQLGGSLEIVSGAGGTRVSVVLPLNGNQP